MLHVSAQPKHPRQPSIHLFRVPLAPVSCSSSSCLLFSQVWFQAFPKFPLRCPLRYIYSDVTLPTKQTVCMYTQKEQDSTFTHRGLCGFVECHYSESSGCHYSESSGFVECHYSEHSGCSSFTHRGLCGFVECHRLVVGCRKKPVAADEVRRGRVCEVCVCSITMRRKSHS